MADTPRSPRGARKGKPRGPSIGSWSRKFLSHLAATSNVSESAKVADISTTTAYDARRANAEFNRQWQKALCEGYDHLEMELLHRMRTGEVKPKAGARRGVRSYDNATAYRLLAAHREAAMKQRAVRDDEDAAAVLAEIDAQLDRMHERRMAAAARNQASDDAE